MNDLLTTAEAAASLHIAPITLARWRAAGRGPNFVRIGKKLFYRPTDIDAWVDEQQQQPKPRLHRTEK